jgi:hypothetical protein
MLPFGFLKVNAPRLIFVATADHRYTFADVPDRLAAQGVRCSVWTWDQVFRARSLPRATYIFTDFDRLAPGPLEISGRIYKRLVAEGVRVLNDPRRFRNRAQLISSLQMAGVNSYGCVQPATGRWPQRYPVFLRANAAHRGIIGQLIHDRKAAGAMVQKAVKAGYLLSDLVLVEYCAEPLAETGHFQKHAALRVGDSFVRANTVNDASWVTKRGGSNFASSEHYASELAEYDNWPYRDFAARVFDVAGMDFGRLDFGIVGGRPQAYEVNTNPSLKVGLIHPNPDRTKSLQHYRSGIDKSLAAVASLPGGSRIKVSDIFRVAPRAATRRPFIF